MKTRLVDAGYSPELSMELTLAGETFNVAALGLNELALRNPRRMRPGQGTVHLVVDGNPILYEIDLFEGIAPERDQQPFNLIRAAEGVPA